MRKEESCFVFNFVVVVFSFLLLMVIIIMWMKMIMMIKTILVVSQLYHNQLEAIFFRIIKSMNFSRSGIPWEGGGEGGSMSFKIL